MPQISGYMEDYWETVGLDIRVPSSGHLSERFSNLDITVKQRCDRLAGQSANRKNVTTVVGSTRPSFSRSSQRYEEKYGRKATQTPWRKLHLVIDPEMNVYAANITTTRVSDSGGQDPALVADLRTGRLIADGAYYSIERGETLLNKGIVPVIPPPSHAVAHGKENTKWHDEQVQYIQDKTIYAFHKKYYYGLRSLLEAKISRIKRCIGATLLTQKLESQKREGIVVASIINLWNAFGRSIPVKNE